MAADNQSLARFELSGIPPAPRGVPKIQVTFKVDANGILQVEAKDLATNRSQTVRVTPTSGLDPESIQRLVNEAERFRETDSLRKELAELRNQAETLFYTTDQALEGYADLVDPDILTAVKKDAERLRKLLDSGADINSIREAYATLETAAFRIAESMYGPEGG
jgi:molecular chaperone DnaK